MARSVGQKAEPKPGGDSGPASDGSAGPAGCADFLRALRDPRTWSPVRNGWARLGYLLGAGLPPLIALTAGCPGAHLLPAILCALLFGPVLGAAGAADHRRREGLVERLATLDTALQEARRASEATADVLGDLCHELRSPLVAVQGYISMIRDGTLGPVSGPQRDGLEIAGRNIGRVAGLIDELARFGMLEAGTARIRSRRFDLHEEILRAIGLLQPLLDQKRVVVEEQSPPGPCRILGDAEKVAWLIRSILTNAIQASPPQGKVVISAAPAPEGGCTLRVWSPARVLPPGTPPWLAAQADGARDQARRRGRGGRAFRLAVAREIVAAHGGRFEYESAGLAGTQALVVLPGGPETRGPAPPRAGGPSP